MEEKKKVRMKGGKKESEDERRSNFEFQAAKEGKTNFELHIFPGCGHLVDLPFSPPATSSLHPLAPPGVKLYMGGANTIRVTTEPCLGR